MTAHEMVTFFAQQSQSALSYVPEAAQQRDLDWCFTNLGEGFKSQLMVALIEWRHNFENPANALHQAMAIAAQAQEILSSLSGDHPLWMLFDFGSACQLRLLITDTVAENLLRQLPSIQEGLAAKRDMIDNALDAALALALAERQQPNALNGLLAKIAKDKRRALLLDTYANYRDLMLAPDDQADVERLVQVAEDLFRKKRKNAYFAGGVQTEGGGPDNDLVVDYHLAAVIKWCERKNPALKIDSIHRWRW